MIVLGAALFVFLVFFGVFGTIAFGHARFQQHNLRPPAVGPEPAPSIGPKIIGMVCLWAAALLVAGALFG